MAIIQKDSVILEFLTRTDKAQRGIDDINKRVSGLSGNLTKASTIAKGFLSARLFEEAIKGFGRLAAQPLKLAANFEQSRNSFKTLVGSFAEADEFLERLAAFDIETPYDPAEIQNVAQTLLGFGRNTNEVLEDLQLLGNAAATSTQANIQSLGVVFGQVTSLGKLQGQDALQFINQGIPIYDLLSDSLGKNVTEIKRLQSEGKITGDVVVEAFRKASEEGGRFEGALKLQSQSLTGLQSTLTGNLSQFGQRLGRIFLPITKGLTQLGIDASNALLGAITPVTDLVESNIAPVLQRIGEILKPVNDEVAAFGRRLLGISDAEGTTRRFFQFLIQGAELIKAAFFAVKQAVSPVVTAIGNLFSSLGEVSGISSVVSQVLTFLAQRFAAVGQVIALVIDGVAGIIQYFRTSNSIIGRFVRFTIGGLIEGFKAIPGVIGGAVEVIRTLVKNAIIEFNTLGLQAKILAADIEGLFSEEARERAKQFREELEKAREGQESVVEAFKRGRDEINNIKIEIPPIEDVEVKVNEPSVATAKKEGEKLGEAVGAGVSDGLKKELPKTISELQDLINELTEKANNQLSGGQFFEAGETISEIDKADSRLQDLFGNAQRAKDRFLFSAPDDIASNLFGFGDVGKFLEDTIDAFQLSDVKPLDLAGSILSGGIGERKQGIIDDLSEDVKDIQSKIFNELQKENPNQSVIAAYEQGLENLLKQLEELDPVLSKVLGSFVIPEDEDRPENLLQRLLGLDDEGLEQLEKSVQTGQEFIEGIFQKQSERVGKEIDLQKNRVNAARNGSAELLQIEEERLAKLEEEQRKALANKQRIANAELFINTAVATSETGKGIASAIGAGFPTALVAVPLMFALVSQIATGIQAAQGAFGSIPSLFEGTDYSVGEALGVKTRKGKDQVRANIDIDERVFAKKYNDPIKHIHSKDIPGLVQDGLSFRSMGSLPRLTHKLSKGVQEGGRAATDRELVEIMKSMDVRAKKTDKTLQSLTKALNRRGVNVTIDKNGIAVISQDYVRQEERKKKRFGIK